MYPYTNFAQQPYSMGADIAAFGAGPAVAAPAAPAMTYGTPLSTAGGPGGFMPPTASGAPGDAGVAPGGKFGNFLSGFGNLAEGLSGLGQLYIGLKSLGIAKDQLAFSKEAYNTNLTNQRKSYNTALEDRIRARAVTEGRASGYADEYMTKNRL